MIEQVQARDAEISRLHSSYRGGQTFSNLKSDFDSNKLADEHRQFEQTLRQISSSMGVQFDLNTIQSHVNGLQHQVRDLKEDNYNLQKSLEANREGNQLEMGRMMAQDQDRELRAMIQETEQRFKQVESENRQLRSELEKKERNQNAFQSNNQAYL